MIITGGEARGRRISSPEGLAVRPTASKIRQAFFNILGYRVREAEFLDVFAGSGLMGLEALSRGAQSLTCIEENKKMVRAIETSIQTLGFEGNVVAGDFRQVIPRLEGRKFDIIFGDPPYKSPFGTTLLRLVDKHNLLADDGILAIEHQKGHKFPADLERLSLTDCRTYGGTGISFFKLADENQAGKLDV